MTLARFLFEVFGGAASIALFVLGLAWIMRALDRWTDRGIERRDDYLNRDTWGR